MPMKEVMTLDDLKLTVARTSGPQLPKGTAFLVSATHALTCAHCVRDKVGVAESIELYFSMWDEPRERQAVVEAVDNERDVALLRLSTAAAVPACPRNSNAVNEARWQAFGYPTPTAQNGITIGGKVRDVDARAGVGERRVIQLQCDEAGDVLQGASGSPVFVNEAIVGIITNQPQMKSEPDAHGTGHIKPAYGALFAMSMAQVASIPLIGDVVEMPPAMGMAAPRPEPTPADLFQQYRQIVEAMPKLMTVKIAGSSGAIETVPLESIYVEPELSGLRTIDDIWNRRRVAVVGEEGLGKGAFLKALNLRLLRADNRGEDALWPLYVELDRYAGQTDRADLVDFALYDLLGFGGDERLREHVKSCAQQSRVVLFCDGLENVGAHYARVVEALSRQPRFIVGVRPGSRTDLGQESGGTLPLQPFDRWRIEAFIGKWANVINRQPGSVDEARFLHDIVSQPSLLELARIPRFLGLICSVMSAGQAVVATRTALIFSAWNTVWRAAVGEESFPRRQGAARALQEMARSIFERGASVNREFDEGELYDALGRAGEHEPDVVVARLLEHEIIAPGRDSGSASRTFRFPFDGFLEYLAAEGLANDDAFVKALPTLRIDRRWIQILPLVAGAIARTRNRLPILRGFLDDLSALATGESLGLHVCLVAECLAEVPEDLRANLAPLPEKTAEELLRVFIDQPSTRGRMRPAVRRLQPPLLREGLENLLEDREKPPDQRAGAAYGLSAFTDRKAFETLVHFAQHGDEAQARGAACLGLARLGREAVGQLVAALRDSELNVRLIAAQCLGRRRDRDLASMVLSAWLDSLRQSASSDLERRVEAIIWMAAIVSVRPESTIPALLHQLGGGGENEAQLAAQVLAQTGSRAAVHTGIRLLESAPEGTVRQVAAETLFRLGTEAATAALRGAIARGDQWAKLGVISGYAATEPLRLSPAADLLADPVDASLTWSMVAPLEIEVFEAQAGANLAGLQDIIVERGREAVLADARATMMQANAAPRPGNWLADLARMTSGPGALERMIAFETIQLLEPDSELVVAGLFNADSAVALRASCWLRARYSDIPIDKLLDRLDALPANSTSLGQSAALNALCRLQHLRTLIERSRNGSRSAAPALWMLSSQFGFHLYNDGRIELPDGQIETDYEEVAGRLNEFAAAAARESAHTADAALALEGAEAEFLAATESRPSDGAGFACRAAIELMFGQIKQVRESIESAIEADPTTALWFRFRGLLCRSSPYSAEAASDFEHAIAVGDHSSINYVDAGDALLACGEFDRAATRFSEALEATPGQPDALFGRGLARCRLSRFKEAVEDLDLFLANTPDHQRAISLRARARAQLAPMDTGAVVDGILQPAEPAEWESLLAQARQLLAVGELDEAFTTAKRVIIAQPFHPAASVLRARVWVERGYPELAVGDLVDLAGRLTESAPREALAVAVDELTETQGEENPRPLTEIQRANGLGVRGVVLAALGVRDRALSDLERAVAGGAGDWKMLDTLAGFYIDDVEGKLDEGLRLAREALQALEGAMLPSDAEKAAVRFTVGRASFKKGLRDEARQALEEAAALAPGDAGIATLLEQVKGTSVN